MKHALRAIFQYSCLIASVVGFSSSAIAQCTAPLIPVVVVINPDSYPQEISWNLKNNGVVIASGTSAGASVCVAPETCLSFQINDGAGDGICCGYGQGSYYLTLSGDTVATGGNYGSGQTVQFNCPPGGDCLSAIPAVVGTQAAPQRNTWYTFIPDTSGMYFVSTCALNTCNTKLWVYDHCAGLLVTNTNEGTIYYDDDAGGCGQQARINALMEAGQTYYIRIGDVQQSCEGAINWSITFNGPVEGCMDPMACNFSPIASVPGVCYEEGDPNCPDGRPDLIVLENTIKTSIYLATIEAATCSVVEGCLTGYGTRDIIRFTTHIKNIGTADYFIGNATTHPTQFSTGNCHGHAHYSGYAEYIMYNEAGTAIPVGFKNGFCVLDLECGDGGTAQYGCGNMGISRQCGDIYGAGLDCQWMDITEVDTGRYTMIVRVNWDNSPDALGRVELSHTNNWAQVCIRLGRDGTGARTITLLDDCDPFIDCNGEVYGSSKLDCEGNCGGMRQMGDVNISGTQEMADSHKYVTDILGDDIPVSVCNDINQDNEITVFDASLISSCVNYGINHPHTGNLPHNHCNFPGGLYNSGDTVTLSILNVDFSEKFVDIGILNPDVKVIGYEFDMHGINIWNVESLINSDEYPAQPEFLLGGQKVISLSYQDSALVKYYEPTPLCRIHYYELTDSIICIEKIVDVVSGAIEQTATAIGGECFVFDPTGLRNFDKANYFNLVPNPAASEVNIDLNMSKALDATIRVLNAQGQLVFVQQINNAEKQRVTVNTSNLANGIYLVNVLTEKGLITKKLVVNH
jgi:hypothetical protein